MRTSQIEAKCASSESFFFFLLQDQSGKVCGDSAQRESERERKKRLSNALQISSEALLRVTFLKDHTSIFALCIPQDRLQKERERKRKREG